MDREGFKQLIERRRSIRRFEPTAIEEAKLREILDAARVAPSAGNLQAYRVLVVRSAEKRGALVDAAYGQSFLAQVPVVLAFVAMPDVAAARYADRGRELYAVQDATIAATFAMLAATALDLGTVWVGAFDTPAVARILGCANGETPVALLPIGVAAESPKARSRRRPEELIREL
jgi:nitroreductase